MATCKTISRTKTGICAGSLNRRILIQRRSLTSPDGTTVDYGSTFVDVATVWAMVETPAAYKIFDGVSLPPSAQQNPLSHIFYIRYRPDVTDELCVIFKGIRYNIIRLVNLEENDDFLRLECHLAAEEDKKAGWGYAIP